MSEPRAARAARQPMAPSARRAHLRWWAMATAVVAACGGDQRTDSAGAARDVPDRLASGAADEGQAAGGESNALGQTRKSKERKPQDAVLAQTIAPTRGFVDTPLTFDTAGGRLLYVNTDAAELCELVVFDLNTKTEVMRVDLKGFT